MFYSHHLLARKAPLGQIWMAATMHAKINRRRLNKLNIINICEEILNPSVPMALRLSGILMGGVVIVYERKVKLLYDDVTRLLVEINEAWKVKAVRDPTVLPKGKSQAKYEDVTLPDNQPADLGDIEKPLQFSNSDTDTVMEFHKSAYVAMRLDNVDEPYLSHNPSIENLPQDNHQVDVANITLLDRFDSHQGDISFFNRFERFDIEGDEETPVNYPVNYPSDHADMPSTLIPSPPLQDEPQKPDEILQQHPGVDANQQSDEDKGNFQLEKQRRQPQRRRARGVRGFFMDHEQTIIPGQMYQSWLQNTSDIVSRRGRKRKHLTAMCPMKMARLMELPPVALACGLLTNGSRDIHYPLNLLKQWMRSTQPLHDSPSGRTYPPQPPAPSSSSPPERTNYHDPAELLSEDFSSSQSLGVSVEKQRTRVDDHEMPTEITKLINGVREVNRVTVTDANIKVTPGNSVDDARSIPSSGSGRQQFLSNNLDVNSGRSNKKRLFSSVLWSGSSLETVAEDGSWHDLDTNFKLSKLPETGLTPDHEMLIETGPTQTQKGLIANQPMDPKTDSIRKQLKDHFDTPGSNQRESLNELAQGMNRKQAAGLFYQACVLASRDFLRVEQKVPYGNILISRGAKM